MKIWIDADACPKQIKELLYRVAERTKIILTLVANRSLGHPGSQWIRSIQVEAGADVADQEIIRLLESGDLVVTADIPLAAETISKGGHALDPRGIFFSEENIRERLSVRNFMDDLRSSGVETGGPAAYSPKDKQRFANELDRFLTRHR
ncbi:YaiI/YqxD family protein [uncultured Desulfuromusa sp.]|uniref:YaiI/YqxD family protein n=1 Tax=uncultured Desulfuromusa sp. TaxID=219183 RepID=UPI002AA8A7F7|nr:YaiI/YqxD family protein [uncultured Desulfuromusa sp.]